MAKKMKLDSLLSANKKNKGIEKMSKFSNKEPLAAPTETKPTTKDLIAQREQEQEHKKSLQEQYIERHQAVSAQKKEENESGAGKRGRKRQYFDPRLKALEMQKISARTKIRLQNLIDAKFDGYTPDKMIDLIYEYYVEKELSKDDRIFLSQLEEAAMEEYRTKPKYQRLFKELEKD